MIKKRNWWIKLYSVKLVKKMKTQGTNTLFCNEQNMWAVSIGT